MKPTALYIISVAAQLAEMSATSLRRYERAGLLTPGRTRGGLRLYSDADVARLRQIRYVAEEWGAGVAGISRALELTEHLLALRSLLEAMERREAGAMERQALERVDEALALLGRQL